MRLSIRHATTYTYVSGSSPTTPATGTFTASKVTLAQEIGIACWVKVDSTWTNNGNVGTKWMFIRDGIDSQPNAGVRQNHYMNLVEGASPGVFALQK